MIAELKNVVPELFDTGLTGVRLGVKTVDHPPRILMLYGSVRERSYSRLATEEAARLLTAMGADVRIFNPSGLPLPDDAADTHPKVMELREMVRWSEGMVWCSPERHGAMSVCSISTLLSMACCLPLPVNRIRWRTVFWRGRNGPYGPCLKISRIFPGRCCI